MIEGILIHPKPEGLSPRQLHASLAIRMGEKIAGSAVGVGTLAAGALTYLTRNTEVSAELGGVLAGLAGLGISSAKLFVDAHRESWGKHNFVIPKSDWDAIDKQLEGAANDRNSVGQRKAYMENVYDTMDRWGISDVFEIQPTRSDKGNIMLYSIVPKGEYHVEFVEKVGRVGGGKNVRKYVTLSVCERPREVARRKATR